MLLKTDGLIIKEQKMSGEDRLITILTRNKGLIRAFVQGTRRLKGRNVSSTQLLCYSRFIIFNNRDRYIINEAEPLEIFYDLRTDIEKLALSQYFCELSLLLVPDHDCKEDYLRLILNSLYMLSKNKRPPIQLKSIFELRLMSLAGYMPNLVMCDKCGAYESEDMFFLPSESIIVCSTCYKNDNLSNIKTFSLPPGVLHGMRHIVLSPIEKLFSFNLSDESLELLNSVSETYLLYKLNRGLTTLDFYKSIVNYK